MNLTFRKLHSFQNPVGSDRENCQRNNIEIVQLFWTDWNVLTFCHIFRGCVLHSQGDQRLQRSLAPAVNIAKNHIKMISHKQSCNYLFAKMQQRRRLVVTLSAPCCFLMLIRANSTVLYLFTSTGKLVLVTQQRCPQCFAALLLHALSRQVFRRKGTEIEGVFFSCRRRFLPYPILLLLLFIKACPALHNYHLGRIDKTGQD